MSPIGCPRCGLSVKNGRELTEHCTGGRCPADYGDPNPQEPATEPPAAVPPTASAPWTPDKRPLTWDNSPDIERTT